MLENYPSIILKPDSQKWNYCILNRKDEAIVWKSFQLIPFSSSEFRAAIHQTIKHYQHCLVLPESFSEMSAAPQKQAAITTKGCKEIVIYLFPQFQDSIVEVEEYTTPEGSIGDPLTESNINKVLRFIFNRKPENVVFLLSNSLSNPLHQTILKNVIEAAGIKTL